MAVISDITVFKTGYMGKYTNEDAATVLDLLRKDAEATFENYNKLLDDFDLARELPPSTRENTPLSARNSGR